MAYQVVKITDAELAYTAGIVDGEGSVSIIKQDRNRPSPSLSLVVSIANNNAELFSFLQKRFGGRTNFSNRWHKTYQWKLQAAKAQEFLQLILPYLLLKREQAELGIAFQKSKTAYTEQHLKKSSFGGGNVIAIDEMERREAVREKIHNLNYSNRLYKP